MIIVTQRPDIINLSGNSIYYTLYSADSVTNADIDIELRVSFKRIGEVYKVIFTNKFKPFNGSVKFNLQDVLHSYMEWHMPAIVEDDTVTSTNKQTGAFYIEFREVTASSVPAWDIREVSNARYVVKAGISKFAFNGNNFWQNYFNVKKPFLTWEPSGRFASKDEFMYLAWLNTAEGALPGIRAQYTVTYTDNTTAQKTKDFSCDFLNVAYIPTGIMQADLESLQPTKDIWFWTIQVQTFNNSGSWAAASESFRYNLDNRNDYNKRTLYYRNSLGGLNSVRVLGVIETNLDYQVVETAGVMSSDYFNADALPVLDGIDQAFENVTWKGDVGHLDKANQDALRDAFLKREVYEKRAARWWPVKVVTRSFKQRSTNDKLFSQPIEWSFANGYEQFYNPDIDFGLGTTSNNVCTATISNLQAAVSFNVGETEAYADYTFTVLNPGGGIPSTVQYQIGSGEWVDVPYPYSTPIRTTHAVNSTFVVKFRAKCNDGSLGEISTVSFGTIVTPPPSFNSIIYNYSVLDTDFSLGLIGSDLTTGYVQSDANYQFNLPAINNETLILTFGSISPSSVELVIGGNTFYPNNVNFTGNKFTFLNVNAPSGVTINVY